MAILPTSRGSHVLLLYANQLINRDGVREGITVTSDSDDPSGLMDAENLLTEWKSDAWRSGSVATRAGAGTPEIVVTHALPSVQSFDFVGMDWSNLVDIPWRADLYAGDPDAAGVLQDTTDWCEPIVQSIAGDFPAGKVPSKLKPTDERIALMASLFRLKTFQTFAAPVTGVDHVRWRFDCTGATGNGAVDYIQASLFYGGLMFRPIVNYSLGTSITPVFRSKSRRSAGNAKVGLRRRLSRSFELDLEYLTDEESEELVTEWLQHEGEFARVFAWREPADAKRHLFYGFQGAFTGCAETFEGVAINWKGGVAEGSPVPLAKSIAGIRIEETE